METELTEGTISAPSIPTDLPTIGYSELRTCRRCGETKGNNVFYKKPGDICFKCGKPDKSGRIVPRDRDKTVGFAKAALPPIDLDSIAIPSTDAEERDFLNRTRREGLALIRTRLPEASVRDLLVGYGIMTEKQLLLDGKPTQIVSYAERGNLNERLAAIQEELKRRGKLIDVTPQEGSAT